MCELLTGMRKSMIHIDKGGKVTGKSGTLNNKTDDTVVVPN